MFSGTCTGGPQQTAMKYKITKYRAVFTMKKMIAILVVMVCCLTVAGCSISIVPSANKSIQIEPSSEPAPIEQEIVKSNILEAVIDGSPRTLELDYAKITAGKILAVYQGYNPRGEKDISICLKLDKNITEGQYSTKDENSEVQIMSGNFMAARAKTADLVAAGEFTFSVNYRSSDWRTYSGTFSALLKGEPYTKFSSNSMTIENASFYFTLN